MLTHTAQVAPDSEPKQQEWFCLSCYGAGKNESSDRGWVNDQKHFGTYDLWVKMNKKKGDVKLSCSKVRF